jgi:hypothetical protein
MIMVFLGNAKKEYIYSIYSGFPQIEHNKMIFPTLYALEKTVGPIIWPMRYETSLTGDQISKFRISKKAFYNFALEFENRVSLSSRDGILAQGSLGRRGYSIMIDTYRKRKCWERFLEATAEGIERNIIPNFEGMGVKYLRSKRKSHDKEIGWHNISNEKKRDLEFLGVLDLAHSSILNTINSPGLQAIRFDE